MRTLERCRWPINMYVMLWYRMQSNKNRGMWFFLTLSMNPWRNCKIPSLYTYLPLYLLLFDFFIFGCCRCRYLHAKLLDSVSFNILIYIHFRQVIKHGQSCISLMWIINQVNDVLSIVPCPIALLTLNMLICRIPSYIGTFPFTKVIPAFLALVSHLI